MRKLRTVFMTLALAMLISIIPVSAVNAASSNYYFTLSGAPTGGIEDIHTECIPGFEIKVGSDTVPTSGATIRVNATRTDGSSYTALSSYELGYICGSTVGAHGVVCPNGLIADLNSAYGSGSASISTSYTSTTYTATITLSERAMKGLCNGEWSIVAGPYAKTDNSEARSMKLPVAVTVTVDGAVARPISASITDYSYSGNTAYNVAYWRESVGSNTTPAGSTVPVVSYPWDYHTNYDISAYQELVANVFGDSKWDLSAGIPSTEYCSLICGGTMYTTDAAGFVHVIGTNTTVDTVNGNRGDGSGVKAAVLASPIYKEHHIVVQAKNRWGETNVPCTLTCPGHSASVSGEASPAIPSDVSLGSGTKPSVSWRCTACNATGSYEYTAGTDMIRGCTCTDPTCTNNHSDTPATPGSWSGGHTCSYTLTYYCDKRTGTNPVISGSGTGTATGSIVTGADGTFEHNQYDYGIYKITSPNGAKTANTTHSHSSSPLLCNGYTKESGCVCQHASGAINNPNMVHQDIVQSIYTVYEGIDIVAYKEITDVYVNALSGFDVVSLNDKKTGDAYNDTNDVFDEGQLNSNGIKLGSTGTTGAVFMWRGSDIPATGPDGAHTTASDCDRIMWTWYKAASECQTALTSGNFLTSVIYGADWYHCQECENNPSNQPHAVNGINITPGDMNLYDTNIVLSYQPSEELYTYLYNTIGTLSTDTNVLQKCYNAWAGIGGRAISSGQGQDAESWDDSADDSGDNFDTAYPLGAPISTAHAQYCNTVLVNAWQYLNSASRFTAVPISDELAIGFTYDVHVFAAYAVDDCIALFDVPFTASGQERYRLHKSKYTAAQLANLVQEDSGGLGHQLRQVERVAGYQGIQSTDIKMKYASVSDVNPYYTINIPGYQNKSAVTGLYKGFSDVGTAQSINNSLHLFYEINQNYTREYVSTQVGTGNQKPWRYDAFQCLGAYSNYDPANYIVKDEDYEGWSTAYNYGANEQYWKDQFGVTYLGQLSNEQREQIRSVSSTPTMYSQAFLGRTNSSNVNSIRIVQDTNTLSTKTVQELANAAETNSGYGDAYRYGTTADTYGWYTQGIAYDNVIKRTGYYDGDNEYIFTKTIAYPSYTRFSGPYDGLEVVDLSRAYSDSGVLNERFYSANDENAGDILLSYVCPYVISGLRFNVTTPNGVYSDSIQSKANYSVLVDITSTSVQTGATNESACLRQTRVNTLVDEPSNTRLYAKYLSLNSDARLVNDIVIHNPISTQNYAIIGNSYVGYANGVIDESQEDQRITGGNSNYDGNYNNYVVVGNTFNIWVSDYGDFYDSTYTTPSGQQFGNAVGTRGLKVTGGIYDTDTGAKTLNNTSKGYTNNMFTELWTKDRYVEFPFAVSFINVDGELEGAPANTPIALSRVKARLRDSGSFGIAEKDLGSAINYVNKMSNVAFKQGTTSATVANSNYNWSGDLLWDDAFKYNGRTLTDSGSWKDNQHGTIDLKRGMMYEFTVLPSAEEAKDAKVKFYAVAINDADGEVTNKLIADKDYNYTRYADADKGSIDNGETPHDAGYAANSVVYSEVPINVVGRIGDLAVEDVGDFRFSNLFKQPTDEWLIPGVIKKVDSTTPLNIFSTSRNILGDGAVKWDKNSIASIHTHAHASVTNMSRGQVAGLGKAGSFFTLPISPKYNPVEEYRTENMRMGYDVFLDVETMGNYYGDLTGSTYPKSIDDTTPDTRTQKMIITPKYYLFDPDDGTNSPLYEIYIWSGAEGARTLFYDGNVLTKAPAAALYTEVLANRDRWNVTTAEELITNALTSESALSVSDYTGTIELLELDKRNFTYVGSSLLEGYLTGSTYNNLTQRSGLSWFDVNHTTNATGNVVTDGIQERDFQQQHQRWFFSMGLPSSSYVTYANPNLRDSQQDIETSHEQLMADHPNAVVVCYLDITVDGEVWSLSYDASKLCDKIEAYIPTNNDTDGDNDGYTKLPDNLLGKAKVKLWNGGTYTIPSTSQPVVIYDGELTSAQDWAITGTH